MGRPGRELIDPVGSDPHRRRSVVALEWLGAVLVVAVGAGIGLVVGAPVIGAALALVLVGLVGMISRYWGEPMLLAATGGRVVSAVETPRLHNLLDGLCLAAGLDPPQIRLVDAERVNLAVVSTRVGHGTIVVTTSLLDTLDLIELEGVVGAGLARIRSGEARRSARLALRIGLPMVVAGLIWRRRPRLGEVLVAVVSPWWRQIVARVAPASVYFEADVAGCLMTRYPPGLIAAYTKIATSLDGFEAGDQRSGSDPAAARRTFQGVPPLGVPGAAHLWLLNPFAAHAGSPHCWEGFSHQPPLDERITLLKDL